MEFKLDTITKSTIGKPCGVPLGISKWCGHPHPQKSNSAAAAEPGSPGRAVWSIKVRSYGMVTEESTLLRRMVLLPAFTEKMTRDADDAVRARDGYDCDGYRLRVEFPRGGGGGGGGRGARGGGERFGARGSTRGPPARRSEYRVLVTGLPPSGSWQDLKDHMREAGDVCFADTFKDGSGVVEFLRHEDMKYAVKKLDDSRFRSHEGEVSYIRVKEDYGGGGGDRLAKDRDRSRSYSPRRRGSPTYSPVRRSYSRSRSRSRDHNY